MPKTYDINIFQYLKYTLSIYFIDYNCEDFHFTWILFTLCKNDLRPPKYDCLYSIVELLNKILFSFFEMTRSRQSENCLHLFMDEILNAKIFTTKRISIFIFMEELNLTSAPLQLRMLRKILRFTLLLFLKLFVISQLFHPILQPEGVSVGAGPRRLSR
jgi:hypothetical protein